MAKWASCGIDYIESMALKMKSKFEKYWDRIHGIMGIAIVLDPIFKSMLSEMYFLIVYDEDNAKDEIQNIRTLCYDLVGEYSSKSKLNECSVLWIILHNYWSMMMMWNSSIIINCLLLFVSVK